MRLPGALAAPALAAAALAAAALAAGLACAPAGGAPAADAAAALDSLNARLSDAYRRRDPRAYAALYTDSAVFEWPALAPVRGPAALARMAEGIWAAERDVELRMRVATRRVAGAQAAEVGAFEQSWRDSAGVSRTEFGRYASLLVRGADGRWRLDRFLGFEDSVRVNR